MAWRSRTRWRTGASRPASRPPSACTRSPSRTSAVGPSAISRRAAWRQPGRRGGRQADRHAGGAARMIEANVKDAETKMQKSLDALAKEILTIRTGRASPALVDKIPVEYYGNPTPLNQLATITIPEARMIIIQPWDRTIIGAVEKAIQKSELGLNPGNDGQLIRVPIPPLNEERRREYARLVKRYAEGAHIAIRNIRREQMDRIKALEKEKKISADEARRGGDQLQKVAERYIGLVDQMAARKEAEIMEV